MHLFYLHGSAALPTPSSLIYYEAIEMRAKERVYVEEK